jgi:leader peptidase (prepilin peptidase)/N-methyltransferase
LLALVYRGGMGGGDIKLMAATGLFLGPYVLFDLFVGVLLGSISGIYLIAVKGRSRKDLIPFGPFLVMGAYATLLWGERAVGAYLKLVGFA